MNTQQHIEEAKKRLSNAFCFESVFGKNNIAEKLTQDFLAEELLTMHQKTIEECIKLSDKIEDQHAHTEFNEWRAFKGFRNEMRDRLEALKN